MRKLENLRWSPKWVSHLGCVKGCLNYLGIEMSDAWLYGGTGHAFIINIHDQLCPSGPTAWRTMMLFEGGNNLGYECDARFGWKEGDTPFNELQENAWEFAKTAINEGLPIYGWELDIAEFYVIYGYDDEGYYYSGPMADEGKGPKPWRELGDTPIGLIEMYCVKPGKAQSDEIVVKYAFQNVLKHAENPKDWIFLEHYASGLKGYDAWIKALESGIADRFGIGYNTEVWKECRNFAVGFLEEAKERLSGSVSGLFDEGIRQYRIVADRLTEVGALYPFNTQAKNEVKMDKNSQDAVLLLKDAQQAEAAGLEILEKIVVQL
jgi:hypothetical protein